jgi:hypothetical protein
MLLIDQKEIRMTRSPDLKLVTNNHVMREAILQHLTLLVIWRQKGKDDFLIFLQYMYCEQKVSDYRIHL